MSIHRRSNKNWEVRYRDNQGRNRSKTFTKKTSAEKFQREVKNALEVGNWSDPSLGNFLLTEVNDLFMKSKINLKPSSKATLKSNWDRHIEPRFGKYKISKISFNEIQDWVLESVNAKSNPVSSERITKAQVQLAQILDFAVDRGYLAKNPARKSNGQVAKITLPKRDITKPKIALTLGELHRLAEACGLYKTLVLLAGTLGLRWAEVVGLQVRDLNLTEGRLQIVRSLSEIHGQFHELTPKSGRSRVISIPDFLIPMLLEATKGKDAQDLVFTTASGTPLRNGNFKRNVFNPAIDIAQIPRITFHELRHTAASNAISAGAKVEEVAHMLGHADKSLTLKVYSHMFSHDERALSNLLNSIYTKGLEEIRY